MDKKKHSPAVNVDVGLDLIKICGELLDVLAKHKIPMLYLEDVLGALRDEALFNTPIQKTHPES